MCPAPTSKLYVPFSQFTQTAELVPAGKLEYLPDPQFEQVLIPHAAVHWLEPSTAPTAEEYVPLTHAVHCACAIVPRP